MCIKINSQQTGSRNLMGPKTLPMIWGSDMTLVTKYQISAITGYWEKCNEKYLGWTRTEGWKEGRTDRRTDRQTEVKQYTTSQFHHLCHFWDNWKYSPSENFNLFRGSSNEHSCQVWFKVSVKGRHKLSKNYCPTNYFF
jgi:hypothetical protein